VEIPIQGSVQVVRPSKIVALGRNYAEHAKEMGASPPKEPMFFLKPTSCLLIGGGEIVLPEVSTEVHHEIELGVVVNRKLSHVTEREATEAIMGYCVFIDVTARDLQTQAKEAGRPWTRAKGFDTFGPVSPIRPASEVELPVPLELRINGELRQEGSSAEMIFSPAACVAAISSSMTLFADDLIVTGTPAGVGPLVEGDLVEARIEGVGELVCRVVRR